MIALFYNMNILIETDFPNLPHYTSFEKKMPRFIWEKTSCSEVRGYRSWEDKPVALISIQLDFHHPPTPHFNPTILCPPRFVIAGLLASISCTFLAIFLWKRRVGLGSSDSFP